MQSAIPLLLAFSALLLGGADLQAQAGASNQAAHRAGELPGTMSYVVHFRARPFDLSALTEELHGARRPARAAELVADLEQRAQQHQAAFAKHVAELGGRVTRQYWLVNGCAIEILPERVAAAADFANVLRIDPDRVRSPHLVPIRASTDKVNHRTDLLQARNLTGAGVGIAILDSGHDSQVGTSSRPHLVYSQRGSTTQSRLVLNKKMGSQPADDVDGHGTAVASVAAGWKWNGGLVADHGHAYDASIAGYAMANNSKGDTSEAVQVACWQEVVKDAAAHKIRVANMSYSGGDDPRDLDQKALDAAVLTADLLVCTSAGNNGPSVQNSQICVNGLSVANVTNVTHLLATSSSRGILDGQVFPDIAGSGSDVYMAKLDDESTFWKATGTSFSSPQVAGIATVIRAAHPSLKADECKAVLLAACQETPESQQTQHAGVGCGYLDAEVAEEIAGNKLRHGRATLSGPKPTWERCIAVEKGKRYRVAIAWHRKDVEKIYWTEMRLDISDQTQVLYSSANRRNTEQFIRFDAPSTGIYQIRVRDVSVNNQLPQDFAWAASADTSDSCVDLVVDQHSISSTTLETGKRYLGKFTVRNVGYEYSVSARQGLYLSDDPVITTSDRFLGWQGVGGLTAGNAASNQLWFTMPTGTPNTVYFGIITDYDGRVPEVIETNNTSLGIRCTVKGVPSDPDLQAGVAISSKVVLEAGKVVDINAGTQNRGQGTAGPSTMMIFVGDRVVKRIDVPSIPSMQSYGGKYPCYIPNCISKYTSLVEVRVRVDMHNTVRESSEINNEIALKHAFKPWDQGNGAPSLEYLATILPGVDAKEATVRTSQGGSMGMCLQIPGSLNSNVYVLFWSLQDPPVLDVTTDFSIGLLNTPVFPGWFGIAPVSSPPAVQFPPLPPLGKLEVYTHGLVFPNTLISSPLKTSFTR